MFVTVIFHNRKFLSWYNFPHTEGKTKAKAQPNKHKIKLLLKIKASRTVTVVFNPQPASNRFFPFSPSFIRVIPFSCQTGYPLLKKQAVFALGSMQGE